MPEAALCAFPCNLCIFTVSRKRARSKGIWGKGMKALLSGWQGFIYIITTLGLRWPSRTFRSGAEKEREQGGLSSGGVRSGKAGEQKGRGRTRRCAERQRMRQWEAQSCRRLSTALQASLSTGKECKPTTLGKVFDIWGWSVFLIN